MADKEQTNDSLKNSDKNFNENCTHNKEQLMIDGVNVDGCKYLNTFSDCDGYHYYCDLADDIKNEYCEYYKDCYFKQLARKTQECEELEELLKLRTNDRIDKLERAIIRRNAKIDRYRKALEEIEKEVHDEMCDTLGHLCAYCDGKHSCITLKILDIISRAKGGRK